MGVLGDVRKNRLPIGYSKGNVEMQFTEIKRVDADKEQLSASIVVKRNNTQETVSATLDWDSDEKVFVVDAEGITASVGDSDSLEVTFSLSSLSLEKTMTLSSDSSVELTSGDTTITYLGNTYSYNEDDNLYYVLYPGPGTMTLSNGSTAFNSVSVLSNSTWDTNTSDVLTYEGIRFVTNERVSDQQYRETLHINSPDSDSSSGGSIRASSIYADSGTTSDTTVNSAIFLVETSCGKYDGVKLIKIEYDNYITFTDKKVRTLRLYY
jgi:hypothetical protein